MRDDDGDHDQCFQWKSKARCTCIQRLYWESVHMSCFHSVEIRSSMHCKEIKIKAVFISFQENTSYSAMLNSAEPVPHKEPIPSNSCNSVYHFE